MCIHYHLEGKNEFSAEEFTEEFQDILDPHVFNTLDAIGVKASATRNASVFSNLKKNRCGFFFSPVTLEWWQCIVIRATLWTRNLLEVDSYSVTDLHKANVLFHIRIL